MWWLILRDRTCDAACQWRVDHMNDNLIPMLIVFAVVTFPVFHPQLSYMGWLKVKSWFRK